MVINQPNFTLFPLGNSLGNDQALANLLAII
jgi:hypothetical protein